MRALALVVIGCAFAAPAFAQGAVDAARPLVAHMAKGIPTTRVGDWVTYKISGGPARTQYWRVGIVSEAKDHKGRDALWVDVEMGTHHAMRSPLLQSRLLIARDTAAEDPITRIYLGYGVERVRELEPDAVRHLTRAEPGAGAGAGTQAPNPAVDASKINVRTGKEKRLLTLAGTVPAIPVEARYGSVVVKRYWLSREVPILQLAKMEIPRIHHSLEVREYGRGYVSRMILPSPDQPKIGLETAARMINQPPAQAGASSGGDHAP